MIRERISQLLKDFDSDVQKVVESVIQAEYFRLDTKRPIGIYVDIRKIIEQEVKRNETGISQTE
jgi:hypothetical protein